MNNRQKLVQKRFLNNEKAVIEQLDDIYGQSLKDVTDKIKHLEFKIGKLQEEYDWLDDKDPRKAQIRSQIQSKIYQKQYQEQLQKQLDGILGQLRTNAYLTVSDYLDECYNDGFIGTIFDLHGQGIPIVAPIDQESMVRAVQLDSKISKGLYTRLGEDTDLLKRKIAAQVTRGISTGMSFQQVAQQLAGETRVGYNNAIRIARTEGHRIQTTAAMDAMHTAKDKGADVVKQWDATLDARTRESHAMVDGEIRELDKPFSNGLDFPGDPSGGASEVVNCRCALLQRARWALDEDELNVLQDRSDFFDLDKTKNFEQFREEYLQAASSSHYLPISERTVPIVRSPDEFDRYVEEHGLKKIYRGYSADSDEQLAEYAESHKLGTVPESGDKSSALGRGIYYADSKSEAESYMYRRGEGKSQAKGRVTTAALDVDAKVGTQSELRQKKFEDESAMRSKIFAAQREGDTDTYNKLVSEYLELEQMSFEDYLRKLGYDAIYDPTTGYTVVVRQKALVIRDD